jgi:MFS family permease
MPRPRFPLAVILAAQFVIPLSISGTAVALPGIASELGSSPGPLQWVVNGFNVAFALCTIVWGVASDRIGYTRSFRAGLVVAVLGSGISAFASDLLVLDVGRIVAGIGAAAVLTGAAPLLSHLFQGRDRTAAFALFGTVNGLGLAAGPALSGLLLTWLDWRGIFAAHAVVLVLALIGSVRLPAIARGRVTSLRTLLDLSALRAPRFLAMALVPVAGAIGFVTYLTYLPAALGAVHGLTSGSIGWLMLIMTVPVLAAPTVVGRLLGSGTVSPFGVVKVSLLCLAVGGIGVVALMRPELPVAVLTVPMLFLGLGFGLPLGFIDAEALAAVPAERSGAASGVINLFRVGSEAVFVAVFSAVLTAVVTSRLPGEAGRATRGRCPGERGGLLSGFGGCGPRDARVGRGHRRGVPGAGAGADTSRRTTWFRSRSSVN